MVDTTQDSDYKVMNEWIDCNFLKTDDYHRCIKEMDRLNLFIEKYHHNIQIDTIVDLLNNNGIFRMYIETIFNHYKKQIESGRLEKLFKNVLLVNSIDVYCIINNIKIGDKYDLTDGDIPEGIDAYYKDIRNINLLSVEEEQDLARRIKKGDSLAKEKFIEANLKLVVHIAKLYQNRGLQLQDLIQEGNIGLMIAVERFDPNRRVRFSTYARFWISDSICKALTKYSRTIRIPSYMLDKYRFLVREKEKLTKELKKEPTIDELSKKLNMTEKEITDLLLLPRKSASLYSKIMEDSDNILADFIPDPLCNVEEDVLSKTLSDDIAELLKNSFLDEREIQVIVYRYGLNGEEPKTLDEVGKMYDITRQRVNQIETIALRKLSASEVLVHFDEYERQPQSVKDRLTRLRRAVTSRYSIVCGHNSLINYYQNMKNNEQANNNNKININEICQNNVFVNKEAKIYKRLKEFMNDENYYKLIEVLSICKLNKLLSSIDTLELIILLLSLGYINGKYYDINDLARMLKMTPEEIRMSVKKTMYENDVLGEFDKIFLNQKVYIKK